MVLEVLEGIGEYVYSFSNYGDLSIKSSLQKCWVVNEKFIDNISEIRKVGDEVLDAVFMFFSYVY